MSFQKCLKTMTSAETISLSKRLPAEVLERIFRHLPPPSLKNVLQVFWMDMCSARYWGLMVRLNLGG